jgi:ribosomal protein L5
MAVPRLTKIVINMGVKGAVENKGRVDTAARDLAECAHAPSMCGAWPSAALVWSVGDHWTVR